jgi:hypothetical protein
MNDYELLVRRIERRTRRRSAFTVHAIIYGFFAVCVLIFLTNPGFWRVTMTLPNTGDLVLVLLVWSALFVAHTAHFRVQEAGDRQIGQVLEQFSGGAKRKHDRLALSEDGELLDIVDADGERHQRLSADDE